MVHLDDLTPADVAVFLDLVFRRVEIMRPSVPGMVADAFVVKHKGAAVAGRSRRIKTVILIHRDVISTGHIASPALVGPKPVGVCAMGGVNKTFDIRDSPAIAAAEARNRAVLKNDRCR